MFKIEKWFENTILRTISRPVKPNEMKSASKLGKEMIKYIKNPDNGWVGLAAPQVWHNIRVIVVSLLQDRNDENFSTIMMINPELLYISEETELDEEWCLSVPGEKGIVKRASHIKLLYLDEKGNSKTLILDHLRARIVQHEIDHLDWVLFTDKLEK